MAYAFTPRFLAGLEFNPVVSEFLPTVNWTLSPETSRYPFIGLNTSSDRIGTPEGNKMYALTFGKTFQKLRINPYVSVAYSETDRNLNFPFGVNVRLDKHFSILPLNDGRRSHLLFTYKQPEWNVTLMYVYLQRFGVSVGYTF